MITGLRDRKFLNAAVKVQVPEVDRAMHVWWKTKKIRANFCRETSLWYTVYNGLNARAMPFDKALDPLTCSYIADYADVTRREALWEHTVIVITSQTKRGLRFSVF